MLFLELNKSRYCLGLDWAEIPIKQTENSEKDLKSAISKDMDDFDANMGVKLTNNLETAVSIGIFPNKQSPLKFPKVYSMAATISKVIENGVAFFKIDPKLLDDSIPENLLELSKKTVKNLKEDLIDIEKGHAWYACAVQDGAVISDGEFIGSDEDVAGFIIEHISLSEKMKAYGSPSDEIKDQLHGTDFRNLAMDLILEEASYKTQIGQLVGFPLKKALFTAFSAVILLGIYGTYDHLSAQKEVQDMANKVVNLAPVPKKDPALEQKKKEQLFLNEVKGNNIFKDVEQQIDPTFVDSMIRKFNIGYKYGYRLNKLSCTDRQCSATFQAGETKSLELFLKYYQLKPNEVTIESKAKKVTIKAVKPSSSKKMTSKDALYFANRFAALESLKSFEMELIRASEVLIKGDQDFDWSLSKPAETTFGNYVDGLNIPRGYQKGAFHISSDNYFRFGQAMTYYRNIEELRSIAFNADVSPDRTLKWKVSYEYVTQF